MLNNQRRCQAATTGKGHIVSTERESITQVWGQSPQWDQGAELLVGGQGKAP